VEVLEEGLANALGRLGFFGGLLLDPLLLEKFLPPNRLGIRIHPEQHSFVDQGILLLRPGPLLHLLSSRSDDALDLIRVDETCDIGVVDLRIRESIALLVEGYCLVCTEDLVQECERAFCPDNKTAEMTTRSELKEVESANVDNFDTSNVTECLADPKILVEHNKGASPLPVSPVPQLSFSSSQLA